ncbi:MAG: threonylcarbamoyl-AMP synthase [Chloroflexi bacterium]|nr:threonylcarbamoyl-AMP synthase [Chloroflexota bacterium]
MQTIIIPAEDPQAIPRALAVLRAGGMVAFPTDTVYGVGALAFDAQAVGKIYIAKGRSTEKAIPILLGDAAQLEEVAAAITPIARKLAARFWPGPLTLVVPRHPSIPEALSPLPTVGVRVPDHPVARALLRAAGPLAVTSANLSGQASPVSAGEVFAQLNGSIPLILDGGRTPGGVPSTVVDCTGPEPVVLRAGPITLDNVLKTLK